MKPRFLSICAFLLMSLLLAACLFTPPRTETPSQVRVTQIYDNASSTPEPVGASMMDQWIDYSLYPPGTIFSATEEGKFVKTRIVPELSQPEWVGEAFPKTFATTLVAGHWKKFLLGFSAAEHGYVVDVSPLEPSLEGAEVVAQVMPEYDGETWVDVLWLFQPQESPPLPVSVRVYTTEGWEVAFENQFSLEPGVWHGYNIWQSSLNPALVIDVNPQQAGMRGDTLQRVMINPEYLDGWQDALRIQIAETQAPMQANATIYRAPGQFLKTEFTHRLEPGKWFTAVIGLSEEQAAYAVHVIPVSAYDSQVESYGVLPVFMDGAWVDVLRVKIPSDRQPLDVKVQVYQVNPGGDVATILKTATATPDLVATELASYVNPTITPDRIATELAAYINTPTVTPTLIPTEPIIAGCPGALPSRLQVGQAGIVSQDPAVANRVRSAPDREAEVLGQLMPGEKFTVLEGPLCSGGWAWWRVRSRTQDLAGWTSEGDAETYWLQPVAAPTATPSSTPTRSAAVPGCIEPPAGLVSWWTGDGNAEDVLGTNEGTSVGGMTYSAGMVDLAFRFNRQNYIQASTKDLPTGNQDRTIEFWANVTTFEEIETFFAGYGKFLSAEQSFHLGAAGKTLFFSQWGQAILGPAIKKDRWYHMAATNQGNQVTLYLDGKAVGTGNFTINTPSGTLFYMGRLAVDPGKQLGGWLDEVSVYNRALSAAEVQSIYQAGSRGKCKPVSTTNAITLTAAQIDGANDIEGAIINATLEGTQPGTVILDGRKGAFVFTDADRSINIFVSNLTLRGVNQAVIKNCGDGLFFDNIRKLTNILVEGIEFICDGSGVVANGDFENVTLQNNIFRAGNSGVDISNSAHDWLITGNLIQATHPGIVITAAQKIKIIDNQISGEIGIILRQSSQSEVQNNLIEASDQGVLLDQESWKNLVQMNTIQGVSHAGVALEPGVTGNQILENQVSCAPGTSCLAVDATSEVAKNNTISLLTEEKLVYTNDFESAAGLEWSKRQGAFTPTVRRFLGEFGNDEVTLKLTNLGEHAQIRVTFELFIIRSWDGNVNPDIWEFKVNGKSLLMTTFDNQDFYQDHAQSYPSNYGKGSNPPRTGAKENNTLGYKFADLPMDSVYLLSFTVPHTSSTLNLTFTANGLMADLADESWGIDNIAIYTTK